MHVPEERLLARVDHLHRPPGVESEHAAVDLHREVLAAAERAPHARVGDAHELGREAEAGGHLGEVHVEPLGRDVEVDAAVLGRNRKPRLGAEEGLVLHAELVLALHHQLGLRPRRLGVAMENP
jgi:hypothetical protein